MQAMRKKKSREPWYVAGLAFECTGCGQCCAGPEEGYVWITDEEIVTIAEHLGISEKQMRSDYVRKAGGRRSLVERPGNNDCIFLTQTDTGRQCRIYSLRPMQCRTWPFWPSNLRDCDDWTLAGMRCGGINRGPIHDCDEIERQRRRTR